MSSSTTLKPVTAVATAVYGSDLLIQLLRESGVGFVTLNPGFSVKGILDSLANADGGLTAVMCPFEGVAVAAAHGYAKAAGKPMAVILHNIVGLQHGTMAIFNAWCDRVPMIILGGTGPLSKMERRPWIDWIHSANDQGAQIRDYVKWDDQPVDADSIPEAFWRAWQTSVAVPQGPVYICLDTGVQDADATKIDRAQWRSLNNCPTEPSLDAHSIASIADSLLAAEFPVLITDYAGETKEGFETLHRLAEHLEAPVVDCGARFNFPTEHRLNFSFLEEAVLSRADVVLALDVEDRDGRAIPGLSSKSEVLWVSPAHLRLRSWSQDYLKLPRTTRQFSAGATSALTGILDRVLQSGKKPRGQADRRRFVEGKVATARANWLQGAKEVHENDRVPVAALALALGEALKDKNWQLASGSLKSWERKLWKFQKHRAHLGGEGGGGCGYIPGAAIGAALASQSGELCVSIVPDGDLLFCPAALWTIANQNLPILMVMHNNRSYENTLEHAKRVARARNRPEKNAFASNLFDKPEVDFAAMARSYGIEAFGPVVDAVDLPAVLKSAIKVVEAGRPVLVDVVTALGDKASSAIA